MFFQSYSHSGKAFIRGYWGESRSFFRFGIGLGYEDGTADWLVRGLLCCFGRGKIPGWDDDFRDVENRVNEVGGGKQS